MAVRAPILDINTSDFRARIRGSLLGVLGATEARIAERCAVELERFLRQVVQQVVAEARMHRKDGLQRHLISGIKVTGRSSLATLRGRIDVYPWVRPYEFGGTIHPHTAQYLAIPIYDGLRVDGTPKFQNPLSWKRWGSFIYTAKDQRKYIVYKDADRVLRFLYVLVESTEVPKKLRINETARALYPALLDAWYSIYVQEAASVQRQPISFWGYSDD